MSYNFLRLPQVQHFRDAAFLACRRQPTPPPFGIDWKIEAKRVKARVTIRPLNGFIGLRCQCENHMTLWPGGLAHCCGLGANAPLWSPAQSRFRQRSLVTTVVKI